MLNLQIVDQTQRTPQDWLRKELAKRQARNPAFSQRMFAKQIKIMPGRLSEILNGKRKLTVNLARKISTHLLLTPKERGEFLNLFPRLKKEEMVSNYHQMNPDQVLALRDWQHFAILNLMDTDQFQNDIRWIAERLQVPANVVEESIERLKRLGLIVEFEGNWTKRSVNLTTTDGISSEAIRASHRQNLKLAAQALENVSIEQRDITSISMAIDSKRIPEAKEMIRKFRRELCAFLESGDLKDEVYKFNLQLIPLTNVTPKKGGRDE